jgi:hypothetical protein
MSQNSAGGLAARRKRHKKQMILAGHRWGLLSRLNPNFELEMGSARVPRASSGVAPEQLSHMLWGFPGGTKFGAWLFRRDAEKHTPEAYAPQNWTGRPPPPSEFGVNEALGHHQSSKLANAFAPSVPFRGNANVALDEKSAPEFLAPFLSQSGD